TFDESEPVGHEPVTERRGLGLVRAPARSAAGEAPGPAAAPAAGRGGSGPRRLRPRREAPTGRAPQSPSAGPAPRAGLFPPPTGRTTPRFGASSRAPSRTPLLTARAAAA